MPAGTWTSPRFRSGMIQAGIPTQRRRLRRPRGGLASQTQRALNRANAANESRYQDILGQYNQLQADASSAAQNLGGAGRSRITDTFDRRRRAVGADLVRRGLTSTSVKQTMEAGVDRDRDRALLDYDAARSQMQLSAVNRAARAKLGFMERRNDVAPNIGRALALQQGMGRAGIGGLGGVPAGMGLPPGVGVPFPRRVAAPARRRPLRRLAADSGGGIPVGGEWCPWFRSALGRPWWFSCFWCVACGKVWPWYSFWRIKVRKRCGKILRRLSPYEWQSNARGKSVRRRPS